MKKNNAFDDIEKKIIRNLLTGEKLSISEIAKRIEINRKKTAKYLNDLHKREWIKKAK
jgi:Mn-dependent DtxR family transcriptional regulator